MTSPSPELLANAREHMRKVYPGIGLENDPVWIDEMAAFAAEQYAAGMRRAEEVVETDIKMSRDSLEAWQAANHGHGMVTASASYGAGKRILAAIRAEAEKGT